MGDKEPTQRTCPADVRAIITGMDNLMGRDRRYNHAGVPGQIIKELLEARMTTSLAEIEGWLREMGSKIYLVAAPLDHYGADWADKTAYFDFLDRTDSPEFTLWVGVNGEAEATELLDRLSLTPDENLARLHSTGFLFTE